MPESQVIVPGYSAEKTERALSTVRPSGPAGLFVNSTIALEGVVRWLRATGAEAEAVRYGCFDWDPFGALLPGNVGMVQQDVSGMLRRAFDLMAGTASPVETILVPCIIRQP